MMRESENKRAKKNIGCGLLVFSVLAAILLSSCRAEEVQHDKDVKKENTADMVHPDFYLSLDDLKSILKDEPESIRQAILEQPEGFLSLLKDVLATEDVLLLLVDKDHRLSPDYEPADLVSLNEYPLSLKRSDLSLREKIMPDLLAMSEASRKEGIDLPISSCYRSYDYQKGLFKRHVDELGLEQAERESARPGSSQHQLGTTIDFGSITQAFAETEAGRWLSEHAGEFGFSLSYPKDYERVTGYMWEPWHYRYIGKAACAMQEQFFDGIQQYLLSFLSKNRDFFKTVPQS